MARSRTSLVLMSRGDPFIGALLGRVAGPLIKGGAGLFGRIAKGIGGIFKRGPTGFGTPPFVVGQTGSRIKKVLGGLGAVGAAGAGFEAGGRAVRAVLGPGGETILLPRRRRRGITATELRGFKKVTGLLRRVGMVPKGLRKSKVC